MKRSMIVVMVVGFIVGGLNLSGQDHWGHRGFSHMRHAKMGIMMAEKNLYSAHMLLRHKEEIGLSAEQTTKIEKMRDSFQEKGIQARADLKIMELKLKSFMGKEPVNRAKLISMIKEVSGKKTDLHIALINHLLDLKELLTKEQIDKIEALKRERMERRLERRSHRFKDRRQRPGIQ